MKKLFAVLTILFFCVFGLPHSQAGEVRDWTSGSHVVTGEFIELIENGTVVRIRKENGKKVRIRLEKLSQEDQDYVREMENSPLDDGSGTLHAGARKVVNVDGLEYAFRWCPPGEFMMGSKANRLEMPVHKVKLTKGFWLLETEVTQEMWESVMGVNPSHFKGWFNTEKRSPVEFVSWYDCQKFCKELSQKLGQEVKLPTEAQWEYACRAGTTGDFAGNLDSMAWYKENSEDQTHPVGSKKPNAWGFYDMHGNVEEWCSDWMDFEFYARSPECDPENTTAASLCVLRGGECMSQADRCRSAFRGCVSPESKGFFGLRVVLVPSPEE